MIATGAIATDATTVSRQIFDSLVAMLVLTRYLDRKSSVHLPIFLMDQ